MTDKRELKALSLNDDVNAHHEGCLRAGNEAIQHAYSAGQILIEIKSLLKASGGPTFGDWIGQYLSFSVRTAQGYMKLHNDLRELPKAQRVALLDSAESVRSLTKMLSPPKPAAPKPPPPPEPATPVAPPEIEPPWAYDGDDDEPEPEDLLPVHDRPPRKTKAGKPVTALEGRALEVHTAKQVINGWADTVGRFLSREPSIDDYRRQFPGEPGDKVLDSCKQLYEDLKAWKKVIR